MYYANINCTLTNLVILFYLLNEFVVITYMYKTDSICPKLVPIYTIQ